MQSQERLSRLEAFGSPTFNFSVGAIAASGKVIIDFETATPTGQTAGVCAKYLPLTDFKIMNNSASTLSARIGSHLITVPPSTVIAKSRLSFSYAEITELSAAAVASGAVYVDAWVEPVTEDIALQRRLGGRLKIGMW